MAVSLAVDMRRGENDLLKSSADIRDGLTEKNCIGSGGFGWVYKVHLNTFGVVALKKMINDVPIVPARQAKNMIKEIKVLANLRHQNIILLLGMVWEPNYHAIIMEYMSNGDLETFVFKYSPEIGACAKAKFLRDISFGLSYIHESFNISHNDLKASNVLLSDSLVAKICDFGLADWRSFSTERTTASNDSEDINTKEKQGATMAYLCPERWKNMEATNKMGDVYSFGIMIWEVYSELCPFSGLTRTHIGEAVSRGQRPQLILLKETPDLVQVLMQQCWDQKPENRPSMLVVSRTLGSAFKEEEMETAIELLKLKVLIRKSEACKNYTETNGKARDNDSNVTVNASAPIQRNSTDPCTNSNSNSNEQPQQLTAPIAVQHNIQPGSDLPALQPRYPEENETPPSLPITAISIKNNSPSVIQENQILAANDRSVMPANNLSTSPPQVVLNNGCNASASPGSPLSGKPNTVVKKVRVPPGVIGLDVLVRIGKSLGPNWMRLASELDISEKEIQSLSASYPRDDVGYQMLRLWHTSKGPGATYKIMARALFKAELNDIGLTLERQSSKH